MKNIQKFESFEDSSKTNLYYIIIYDAYKYDSVYGRKIVLLLRTRSEKDTHTIRNEFEESEIFKKMCKEPNTSLTVKVRPTEGTRISGDETISDAEKRRLKY